MPRLQFYAGTWNDPPPQESIYTVPLNPYSFEPLDEANASWDAGIDMGGWYPSVCDNRARTMEWANLPSYEPYVNMIHTLENYQGYQTMYMNLGNSLLPGLYSTGDDWREVSILAVVTEQDDGKNVALSGSVSYNKYKKVTLYFSDLGDANA